MKRTISRLWWLPAFALACSGGPARPIDADAEADAHGFTAPSRFTREAQQAVAAKLALDDAADFEDAKRGFLAGDENLVVKSADGRTLWDLPAYAFVKGDAPPSVNPSLWRQAKLNAVTGLFQVAPGIYQVRGYDVSNMTWIRGKTGWIVVDPLTTLDTATAAVALARKHIGSDPVSAVIFTHSHVDHFGGIGAVLPEGAKTPIVAPARFLEEATSENVIAGLVMGRRATFQFGSSLPRSERGHVDTGLGRGIATGGPGLRAPTILVDRTPQAIELDGVSFVFQYTPESEAPAELTFYLPERKAFCGAEIVNHTLHNLYTLRGAKVRDALKWSGYIDEAIRLFGDAEVVFGSHTWPVWGKARVAEFLKGQRDTYRYIHDQTLRLANEGATSREIAEEIELPEPLAKSFANRGYYGTVKHNAKAVYQWYFGWYDGNPANLDPLPPAELGTKYVEAMGGAAEVKRKARQALERGEYRWVATLVDHLVFADPGDAEARELLASAYDQLGYQAESGVWRDVYLTGAYELRHGVQGTALRQQDAGELLRHVPLDRFFAAMATRLDAEKAADRKTTLNFVFTDLGETHVLELESSVLHHRRGDADPDADATLRMTHDFFLRLVTGQAGLRDMIFSDELDVDGNRLDLLMFFSLLERPDGLFAIVTP